MRGIWWRRLRGLGRDVCDEAGSCWFGFIWGHCIVGISILSVKLMVALVSLSGTPNRRSCIVLLRTRLT